MTRLWQNAAARRKEDPAEEARISALFTTAMVAVISICAFYIVLNLLFANKPLFFVQALLIMLLALLTLFVAHQGHVRAAALLFIVPAFIALSIAHLFLGGVSSVLTNNYFLIAILVALILGIRSGIVILFAASIVSFITVLLRELGVAPPQVLLLPIPQWIAQTGTSILTAIITFYAVNGIQESLRRMKQSRAELAVALDQLKETSISRAYLNSIVQSLPHPLLILERPSGKGCIIRRANTAALALLGYAESDLLNKSINDIWVLDEFFFEDLTAMINGSAQPIYRDTKLITHTGESIPVLYALSILQTPENLPNILLSFQDQRERQQFVDQLRSQAYLLEHVSDAIIATDTDNHIQHWNKGAERIYGWQAQEVLGKPLDAIIQNDYTLSDTPFVIDQQWQHEVFQRRKDGSQISILETLSLITDSAEKARGVVIVAHDITARRQTEAALRLRNRAIEASSAGITIADATQPDMPLIYANHAFERITGYLARDVLGKNCRFLQGSDQMQPEIEQMRAALRAGKDCDVTLRNYRKDGSLFWNELRLTPIHDGYGNLTHYVGIMTDVTARIASERLLRDQEALYRTLVRNLPQMAVFIYDHNLRYLLAEGELLSRPPSSSIQYEGSHLRDVMPLENAETLQPYYERALKGEAIQLERRAYERIFYSNFLPLRREDGSISYGCLIVQDVTDLRETEHVLRRYTKELQRSNRELQDFAYVASHDLQEPLRKIQAFSDRIISKHHDELSEEVSDHLDRIKRAAERMQLLMDALLAFSRVTTKGQPFEEVDLNAVVAEVLRDLDWRVEQTGAQIALGNLPTIMGDATQLQQLMQNLIANALKYHQPDHAPKIAIHSTTVARDDQTWQQISIADNGIGFDEKYAERIFGVFQRLHARGQYEGTGIGLAICRKIVERHNGKIYAHSKPGVGSTFIVELLALWEH